MLKSLMFTIAIIGTSVLSACKKKETIYMPKYLDADVSFLNGVWEWETSVTSSSSLSGKRDFIHYGEIPSNHCTLTFHSNGKLSISYGGGNAENHLKLTGLNEVGNLKIVTFRGDANELIRFTHDESKNTLTTGNVLFPLEMNPCSDNENIILSIYEKV